MTPLAVTGLGVVSALGVGRTAWFDALLSPGSAQERAFRAASPEVLDNTQFPQTRVAEVWGWDANQWLGEKGHRSYDRLTKFLITAATDALDDASLKRGDEFLSYAADRIGICSATAYGSLDAINEIKRISELEAPRFINPTRFPNTVVNAAAGYVSIWQGIKAPNSTIVNGNCGAIDAILNAEAHLMNKRGDAFLVGGGEVVSEPLYVAMEKLRLLATVTRPEGLTMGEGAAYLVLERMDDALHRNARIRGEVLGYGTAFGAPLSESEVTHSSAEATVRALRQALDEANLVPEDIDVVASATSGLTLIDQPELEGIQCVFGDRVAVIAPKQLIGETFGVAGAFGLAMALGWIDGSALPTVLSGEAPPKTKTVLVNSVGFYGNVSCVIVRHHNDLDS